MERFHGFVLVGLICVLNGCLAGVTIRKISLEAPSERPREYSQLELECSVTLEPSDTNYVLKWFFNNKEFSRYTSNNVEDPIELFQVPGVRVNKHFTDGKKVLLEDITYQSRGMYKCEVSVEGSESKYAELEMKDIRFYSGHPQEQYSCFINRFDENKSVKIACYISINDSSIFNKPWNFNWYKDDQLFHSQTSEGVITNHHLPGLNLDAKLSDKNNIVLHDVTEETLGKYVLEITLPPTSPSEELLKYNHGFDFNARALRQTTNSEIWVSTNGTFFVREESDRATSTYTAEEKFRTKLTSA